MRRKAGAFLLLLLAAALQLGAGRAPGAAEVTLAPATGGPGSSFAVIGRGFSPGPVRIHWDDVSGTVLATGSGPGFSVTATVPGDAAPGTHQVFAVADDAEESAAFQVTGTATTTAAPAPNPTRGTSGVGGGTGVEAAPDVPTVTGPPASTVAAAPAGAPAPAGSPTVPALAPADTASATGASTTATGSPGEPGVPGAAGAPGTVAAASAGDGASVGQDVPGIGTAAGGAPPGRRSGGIGSRPLLAVGLAMVLGGGAFLVIRNQRRGAGTA